MKRLLYFVLIVALVFCTSCSSLRMRYESRVKVEDGREGVYEFEKSYSVGAIPVFCGVTAIFFGGACWYYLVMPTTGQQNMAREDAVDKLNELLGGKDYTLSKTRLMQQGWGDQPEASKLDLNHAR